jgi:hypothetical protein
MVLARGFRLVSTVNASTSLYGEADPYVRFSIRYSAESLAPTSCWITLRIAGTVGMQFGQITALKS